MITLVNDYFKIDSCVDKGDEALFSITLLPDYCAYEGHFPDNPVSPGVCNIQMIKECAEQLAGKHLFLGYISQCRLSAVMTPQTTPQILLRMQLSESEGLFKVKAVITNESCHLQHGSTNTEVVVDDEVVTFIEFKGELTTVK